MPHLTAADLAHDAPLPSTLDTLVVGAGMAGLYTTWRVLDHDPGANILIFERSGRTGGRLDSDLIEFGQGPTKETVKEEEGGMRFTLDLMDNLLSLFLILGLDKDIVPFPMGPSDNNRLYFRGRSFTNTEANADHYALWDRLYHLAPAERGIDPSGILDTVLDRILKANPHFQFPQKAEDRTPELWQSFRLDCRWNDVPLKDWTLWNLFTDMGYSSECITLLYGLAGFNGAYLSRMNAGEAFQLLEDFPTDPDFKTLKDGFSTLPNALVRAIGADKIFLNTQLVSIDKKTAEGYVVTYTTHRDEPGTLRTLTAKKLILALPRAALEALFLKSNALNTLPEKQTTFLWNALQTTTNQPLAKFNLYYDHAWWGSLPSGPRVEYGPNFSDLPLGSVYPFYSIDEENIAALEYENWLQDHGQPAPPDLQPKLNQIAAKKFRRPAALTIYCDYLNINFWRALQENGLPFDSPMQRDLNNRNPQTVFPASEAVVKAATEFFQRLFNTPSVPRPVLTSARIWEGSTVFGLPPGERFDYGVHQWGLHADDRKVIPFLTEPLEGLYTCNEAYSDYQGWVEGSLRSANLVLKKAFGLEPIATVYKKTHDNRSPATAIQARYAKNIAPLIRKYIDPDFSEKQEAELAAAQKPRRNKPFAAKLTGFDPGRA